MCIPEVWTDYEESLKNLWNLNNCLDAAERKGHVEGKEEGLAEGRAEGEVIGEARGVEKGAQAKNIENARNLKKCGVPVETTSKALGLSIEEINKL